MLTCWMLRAGKTEAPAEDGAVPAYLLDREHETQVFFITPLLTTVEGPLLDLKWI
jgi:hypothetical protein